MLNWVLVLEVFLIGISLSMDALAVSVTDGLCYRNLTKKKCVSIPAIFGIFQAIMPLIGFFIAFGLGQAFKEVFDIFDHWVAFALLLLIGGKMVIDAIKDFRTSEEEVAEKQFSFTEVLLQGVATSIDALFVGVSFVGMFGATGVLSESIPAVLVSVIIIGCTTFIISLLGLVLGVKVGNVLSKKTGVTELVGGIVLILIGVKIVLSGYGILPF